MVLGSPAAHAVKIACRQNGCADKSLRPARAVPFYLAYPRQRSYPVPLSSAALTTLHIGLHSNVSIGRLARVRLLDERRVMRSSLECCDGVLSLGFAHDTEISNWWLALSSNRQANPRLSNA